MSQKLENMKDSWKDSIGKNQIIGVCKFCNKPISGLDLSFNGMHYKCDIEVSRLKTLGIDERFWNLPNFKIEPGNKVAYEATEEFIKDSKRGLLFFGQAGTGKTHLAVKIALETKLKCKFVKIPRLLMELKANFDGSSFENENIINKLSNMPLLILDDLGAEKASEWVAETIYVLIDERYGKMLPTIITSNYEPSLLAERLGDRILSRLSEMCRFIEIKTSDKRQEVVKNVYQSK